MSPKKVVRNSRTPSFQRYRSDATHKMHRHESWKLGVIVLLPGWNLGGARSGGAARVAHSAIVLMFVNSRRT